METKPINLKQQITLQEEVVSRALTRFVKDDSSKNKKALVKAKIELDCYIKINKLCLT